MSTRKTADDRTRLLAVVSLLIVGGATLFWAFAGGGGASPAAAPEGRAPESAAPRAADVAVRSPTDRTFERADSDASQRRIPIELRGLVCDTDGRAVSGAVVVFNGPGDTDRELLTDSAGSFTAEGLAAAVHQIVVSGAQLLTHAEFVDLTGGASPVDVTLRVDIGVRIAGQVFDDQQRPLEGARVTPRRRGPSGDELDPRCAVTTDGGGRFELRGAAIGYTSVVVEVDGFAPSRAMLQPSRHNVVPLRRAN